MKALITQKVTLTVEPGSIVEISESQFMALGDKAVTYKEEAKEAEPFEVAEAVEKAIVKRTASKKTSRKK